MPNSPDQSPDKPEPDETAPFWPFAQSFAEEPEAAADDDTRAGDVGTAGATREQRPVSGAPGGSDETVVQRPPGVDATSVQEPVPDAPRWTARANVPSPGDPALRRPAPQEWVEEEDPYHGRSWFTPVIVSMVALVLVAALSAGIWLIYRATANGHNAPVGEAPLPSVASSSPVPSPTTATTTEAAPSSEAPSSSAPPAGPVVVPPLRGDTLAEATVKLQVLGLNVDVERQADDSLSPGEVLSSRPGEGETVAPGDTVTLVVATAPSPAPSKSSPAPSGTVTAGG
jgi:hypothetical protein